MLKIQGSSGNIWTFTSNNVKEFEYILYISRFFDVVAGT